MTIEVSRRSNLFSYRQNVDSPTQLEWRINQSGKRWQPFGEPFASELLARQALLKLTQTTPDRGAGRGTR
jgi:hypothetical protein